VIADELYQASINLPKVLTQGNEYQLKFVPGMPTSLSQLRANYSPNFGLNTAMGLWTPCRYFISVMTVASASGIKQLLDLVWPESPNLSKTFPRQKAQT
jgi:hypothetical protein